MRKAMITVKGVSPLSWSRPLEFEALEGESKRDTEARLWRDRFWSAPDGKLFVPPLAIKNGLVSAAKYRGEKIPGKGSKTWTGKFEAGILAFEPMSLGVTAAALDPEWLYVPGQPGKGKQGKGPRVWKCFPRLLEWGGTAEVFIVDDIISKVVFEKYFESIGKFIGWGRFRVENGGYYGRFEITKMMVGTVKG